MHDAPVGGHHAELALVLAALAEDARRLGQDAVAVVGVDEVVPQLRRRQERLGRVAEQVLDLRAHVADGADLVELGDVADGGRALHELAVAQLGLRQALAQAGVVAARGLGRALAATSSVTSARTARTWRTLSSRSRMGVSATRFQNGGAVAAEVESVTVAARPSASAADSSATASASVSGPCRTAQLWPRIWCWDQPVIRSKAGLT